ncbi:MAG TPA: amidohydrolase family protein [Candidatus Limnocylindrales bacterium]|nr:amidohydrolase family protein [Candidatus Limnocylindrales bacterium]
MKIRRYALPVILLVIATFAAAQASAPQTSTQPTEEGKWLLHKFAQHIGQETYTLASTPDGVTLTSDFKFTDRGQEVPLKTTLSMAPDLTPRDFESKGKMSRFSPQETTVHGRSAGNVTVGANEPFFDVASYAPVAVQMMLVRYWRAHGKPASLKTLPSGAVQITDQGPQDFSIAGKKASLHHVTIRGLIWGMEALWFDAQDHLIALVGVDGEFDHFEAVDANYEDGLSAFISTAARENMSNLAQIAAGFSGQPVQTIAIVGGRLIDATGRPPMENSAIVIRDGMIVTTGPASRVQIPKDAQVIHAEGKSVLPGLWEMHAHFEQVEWGPIYLATGVTTARDVGNEREFIVSVRDAISSGKGLGPRLLMAGIVDGTSQFSLGVNRVDTPEQAREQVQQYKKDGALQIKVYSSVKPDILKIVTAEAHKLGMTVTGHVPVGMNAMQAIDDGMDQINHIQYITAMMVDPKTRTIDPDSEQVKDLIAALQQHHTVVDPTMALMELFSHPRNVDVATFEPGFAKVAPEIREPIGGMGTDPANAEQAQKRFGLMLEAVKLLHDAHIPIVAGTDQAVPGYSVDREIELYVKAGFTPMEAIQSATLVPARAMGLTDSGTLQVGKRGDVIIVDGNPAQNISDIRKVTTVITGGRIFQPAPLWKSVGFQP